MSKKLLLLLLLIFAVAVYFMLPHEPGDMSSITRYTFKDIKSVVLSNDVIVQSEGSMYIISSNGIIDTLPEVEGTVLGNVGHFLVVKSGENLRIIGKNGTLLEEPLSITIKEPLIGNMTLPTRFGIGDTYVAILKPLDEYHVSLTFYYPESGKLLRYILNENPRFLKLLSKGPFTVLGGYPDWNLYYFINGTKKYKTKIPVECGYEDYGKFSLELKENGIGYTLTSMNSVAGYFDERGIKSVGLNPSHCAEFSREQTLTTAARGRVFDGCLVLAVKGNETYLGFYNMERYLPNLAFKAPYTNEFITSRKYALARYENYSAVFDCSGEILRIGWPYDGAYPFGDDFLLVRYDGTKTLIHMPLANKTYELEKIKIIGVINRGIVGTKENELLILKIKE